MTQYVVRIRGEYACFTRPEFKTERVSYEVITPSAARGVLEAVLWKPAIRWHIRRILLLARPRFIQFRRNEVTSRASVANARKAMRTGRRKTISRTRTVHSVTRWRYAMWTSQLRRVRDMDGACRMPE